MGSGFNVRLSVSLLSLGSLAATALVTTGCPGRPDFVFDECLEVVHLDGGVRRVTERETSGGESQGEEIGQVVQGLNVKWDTVWDVKEIPVCWETWGTDFESVTMREDVRSIVTSTWEAALADPRVPAEDHVKFTGWGRCNGDNDGIRIVVEDGGEDDGPHVKQLGANLRNVNKGMSLNFKFTHWSPGCGVNFSTRRWCNRVIAVHEFGHALGLAHEQNRIDTDRAVCTDAPQGSNGDIYFGEWDEDSVMNYCNNEWNNYGELSAGDRLWIAAVYYPEVIAANWCEVAADRLGEEPGIAELSPEERRERIIDELIAIHQQEALSGQEVLPTGNQP